MGETVLFEHKLTFDEGNLKDKVSYLYDLMDCPKDISTITARINLRNPAEYEENEKLKPLAKELQSKPLWERLLMIKVFFDRVGYKNTIPYHFEKTISPFFFRNFPKGKIWFVEKDQGDLRLIFRKESDLAEKLYGFKSVLQGKYPQSMSGLQIYDILQDFGLALSLMINYPEMYGANAYTFWGSFLFIPSSPINILKEYKLNITDSLSGNLDLLYSDDTTVSRGPRPRIKCFEAKIFPEYLEWYVSHLASLMDFIFNIKGLDKFYLFSLTLSRVCVETYLIHSSWSSFVRKIAFFNLLDKYASLVKEYLKLTVSDVEIWKKMLTMSVYEGKIKTHLEKIDKAVGSSFEEAGGSCYKDNSVTLSLGLEDNLGEEEICKLLRAYRNSHHGYLLRPEERRLILSHSGNISNALPDLSVILWHALLQNPQDFIKSLS